MDNYRKCLELVNSPEHYLQFSESGFYTHIRGAQSAIDHTLQTLESHFTQVIRRNPYV